LQEGARGELAHAHITATITTPRRCLNLKSPTFPPTTPPNHPPQVFELYPGVDSSRVWREARLMRMCSHPRIVPLLGVAVQVSAAAAGAGAGVGGCSQAGSAYWGYCAGTGA